MSHPRTREARVSGFWPLLAPSYHEITRWVGGRFGYVAVPVALESVLFVGLGSALVAALLEGRTGPVSARLAAAFGLQLLWNALHGVTRWGGRVRIVSRPLSRAFAAGRGAVTAASAACWALVAVAGLEGGAGQLALWLGVVVPHTALQIRWWSRHRDLWSIAWDDPVEERRTAFGKAAQPKHRAAWEEFLRSVAAVQPEARIVDIGSGNLEVSRIAQDVSKSFRLFATDVSAVGVAHKDWARNIEFQRWSFEETDFPDGYLDAVTSSYAIEYADDLDVALAEVFRILRSGGRAGFLVHHPESSVVAGFRRSIGYLEHLRATGLPERLAAFGRNPSDELRVEINEGIAALRRSKAPEAKKQADLLVEILKETKPAPLLDEFEMTNARNWELTHDLVSRAEGILRDAEELGAHFSKVGFEIERLQAVSLDGGVKAYSVRVRKPHPAGVIGLGDALGDYENDLTRRLPRDVAEHLVTTLLANPKRNIDVPKSGGEARFRVKAVVSALEEVWGSERLREVGVAAVGKGAYRVVEGEADTSLWDIRQDKGWIGSGAGRPPTGE